MYVGMWERKIVCVTVCDRVSARGGRVRAGGWGTGVPELEFDGTRGGARRRVCARAGRVYFC